MPSTTEIPETPPVEKLLGNLKKYTPIATKIAPPPSPKRLVLSGMSNFEQVKENIDVYSEEKPLNEKELETLQEIVDELMSKLTPCTGCRYCVEHCPQGLDIPKILNLYNQYKCSFNGVHASRAFLRLAEGKRPSDCVSCRACEAVCPQKIRISEHFAECEEFFK